MKPRVLIAHNYYQQPGGEDEVFHSEARLLESHGHEVVRYTLHNDQLREMGRLAQAGATFWNRRVCREMGELIRSHRAEIVHLHNIFPLMSPAAYSAARAEGAAVVQTLHNFRLLCVSPYLYREGRICERCVGKFVAWPGVVHGCYRGSRSASAVVAAAMSVHRAMGTWRVSVDAFIAPSAFAREKLVEGGLPGEKIAVKPNFLDPDPGIGEGGGGYAVFVGRLTAEKGLPVLLEAWSRLPRACPLKVVGDGPLAGLVQEAAKGGRVEWLGQRPSRQVYDIIGQASFLVLPSGCYETFGRVVIEAFAKGTPVIASRLGALAEVVKHGRTGLLFRAGDAEDLAAQARLMLGEAGALARMRQAARAEYEAKYTGGRNYEELSAVYERAMAASRQASRRGRCEMAEAVRGAM